MYWPLVYDIVVVQLLSLVWLFVNPRTATFQASLFFTISRNLIKLMSIEYMMASKHLILCHPFLLQPSFFPSIRIYSNESALCIRWSSTGASASASILLMNIQGWFALGLPGFISFLSKRQFIIFMMLLSSVQALNLSKSLQPNRLQHESLPCHSPNHRAYSNSCPLHQRCHATISSSDGPYSHL